MVKMQRKRNRPGMLLSCYTVMLLSCYPIILLYCYAVILLCCYTDAVMLLYCYAVILLWLLTLQMMHSIVSYFCICEIQ